MSDYVGRTKMKYRFLAHFYGLMDKILFPLTGSNPRSALANRISNEGLTILDICTGTGASALCVAASTPSNQIIGIDLSEDMLNIARRKASRLGLTNIQFCNMDATELTLEHSVDVVTTSLSLHEMPPSLVEKVLSEMTRLLKPEGKMLIVEWERPKRGPRVIGFLLFPALFEPKGLGKFLNLDWSDKLQRHGLVMTAVTNHGFTKLIEARRS